MGINATLECHGHIIYYNMNGSKHRPSYTHTHVIAWISEITFADIISWHFTGHFQLILKEYACSCKHIGIFFVSIPTHFFYLSKNFCTNTRKHSHAMNINYGTAHLYKNNDTHLIGLLS